MPMMLISALGWAKNAFAAVVAFCAQPPGSYLALVAVAALAFWFSGQRGYDRGQSNCQAAHKAAVAMEVSRQKTAVAGVVGRSDKRTAVNATIDQKNAQKVKYVVVQAKTRPGADAACVPADLADRLRGLD